MKKFILVIVAVALYLHFYPSSELNLWYEDKKSELYSIFASLSDTHISINTDKVYGEIARHFDSFSSEEMNYVRDITSSTNNLKTFHQNYCEKEQRNDALQGKNQQTICKLLKQYRSLL
jgi:hypothetical protein